jgi:hypothetical protein
MGDAINYVRVGSKQFAVLQIGSLSNVQPVQMPMQFAQEISSVVKESFPALNISLPLDLSESVEQIMKPSCKCSSEE